MPVKIILDESYLSRAVENELKHKDKMSNAKKTKLYNKLMQAKQICYQKFEKHVMP